MNCYILDENNTPILQDNPMDAWKWGTAHNRRVAYTKLPNGVRVSTIFLVLDHSFEAGGPPVLWETMIFGGRYDQAQDRYTSHEAALVGHAAMVKLAQEPDEREKDEADYRSTL